MNSAHHFSNYMKAKTESDLAYSEYCKASTKLENARIKERYHEIKSQYDPVNSKIDSLDCSSALKDQIKVIVFDAADYIISGRK